MPRTNCTWKDWCDQTFYMSITQQYSCAVCFYVPSSSLLLYSKKGSVLQQLFVTCFKTLSPFPLCVRPVSFTMEVEIFHRKLVGRLAKERAADACARYTKASTQLGSINSFSELGAVLESTGPTIGEEQGAPREHALSSNEV